ncbi:tRNA pseudouridine(54/55) synthase [Batrachochytrium salamandrivorans]|nr:tRNA pseudouridine(54/55) synthase [Batrachochytrium salamandrivorans]
MINLALAEYQPIPRVLRICITAMDKELDKLEFRKRICKEHDLVHDPDSAYQIDLFLNGTNELQRVEVKRFPLQLSGYYLKNSREVSQTPMIVVDGANGRKRIGVGSVEEFIADPIIGHFYPAAVLVDKKQRIFLAGAGREDVNVRTLDQGRQFILTIENPNFNATPSSEFLAQLEAEIAKHSNGLVTVFGLKLANEMDKKHVLHSAEFRRKRYQLAVEVDDPVITQQVLTELVTNMALPLIVHQQTPIRVAHRRSMMVRDRKYFRSRLLKCQVRGVGLYGMHTNG